MKIFLFYFEMAIKNTGSAQNYRVGRVSGNTPILFRPYTKSIEISDLNHQIHLSILLIIQYRCVGRFESTRTVFTMTCVVSTLYCRLHAARDSLFKHEAVQLL